jgi:hypothetical protein
VVASEISAFGELKRPHAHSLRVSANRSYAAAIASRFRFSEYDFIVFRASPVPGIALRHHVFVPAGISFAAAPNNADGSSLVQKGRRERRRLRSCTSAVS